MLFPLFLLCILVPCLADYDCLCTYQVETNIYEHPDFNSAVIGHLYEFDCKPAYNLAWVDQKFQAIGDNHKLGFVEQASQNSMQVCQGSIPVLDKVPPDYLTAPTTTSTTTTTVPTTKTTQSTTTVQPTTTTQPITTTQPTTTTQPATPPTKAVTTNLKTASMLITKTSSAMPITTQKLTTKFIPITSQQRSTRPTPNLTIIPSTKFTTHRQTTVTTTRAHAIVTVPTNTVQGNNYLCPQEVKSYTPLDNLYVHGSFCYEFVNQQKSFFHAEFDCPKRGGVMVYIRDKSDQDFIYSMLKDLRYYDPVWLGLHDVNKEEAWEWVSDYPVKYTNWIPGRYYANAHDKEDCGIIVAARRGQWDDIHCDGILFYTEANFPWICQYNITQNG